MALVAQSATFIHQYLSSFLLSKPRKSPQALKLGILSSAQINAVAVIHPVETHPDVILYAIASRNAATAAQAAKQYNITKSYGSYQDLLDDPAVDIVYVSTPNGQHYEWTSKALQAGKHVLCEKPFTSNADEAKGLVSLAKEKGLTLEEAFHWQFHPAAHAWRHILESGQHGRILRTKAVMTASPGVPKGDIRWQYDLGGGSAMDMTYALSFTRYALRARHPKAINSVTVRVSSDDPRVDAAMYAYLTFVGPRDTEVHSQIYTDMERQWIAGVVPRFWELPSIEVETERAIIFFYNAMMPHLYHYIAVTDKTTGQTRYHKQYKGGPLWANVTTTGGKGGSSHWSTYRWQLEAFVDVVKGKTPTYWIAGEDSICQMECIDALYQAAGLPLCESLLVAYNFLKARGPKDLSGADQVAANKIYAWASDAALPSPVYAQIEEPSDVEQKDAILEDQVRSKIALSVLSLLAESLPISKAESAADVVIALASFSSTEDPWTPQDAFTCATTLLDPFASATATNPETNATFWSVIERILKDRIRPLFAKTRNPAITSAGRKNFHPVPLPRFDASILDPETKPWKIQDIYAMTVLSWIIQQYKPTNQTNLEAHFPLLVPPILALIDDDTTAIKTQGCALLRKLLTPIQETQSPILHRTNLTSVFEDALKPCLLSLPTITPEPDSISLLKEAYPALLTLQKTTYTNTPSSQTQTQSNKLATYISRLTTTLRENLIPSFHHISSTNPTSLSPDLASFPYPRLSTLLLEQVVAVLGELGIHTTKFLREIVPLVHDTLANPFGTAYPPLLLGGVEVARVVVLNAHPRVWMWRGEILGAVCACWLHVCEEEREIVDRGKRGGLSGSEGAGMERIKKELRGVVYLLKFALRHSIQEDGGEDQLEAKENLEKELQELVDAEESLRGLLLEEIDANDGGFFGEA
ncbi:hypothetical protein ANOM_001935 [Aspergillus nomiae NRRL 13137]|uniref:D-xylose 1-dehydrogenase (NADP(+), D-xylono-1,5-lactone-forming) n=1 Tax=Aspergillus nomiae NRRL (strain ATCC 15546 / NRRL 13137 / CBS 260.88 / M93) TaxID=1509407 RepID=A0A0L1JDR2_ASPN3|nr:uncharacterized protein ANOM_001935 [Aspergillus nomiae NRRL 13137]KNG89548.1 hypothetical protein ANOM_001935 [Aspergillus nomiae NRRL 13137]